METQVKVYGDTAKMIQPGDVFVPAHLDNIEGHDVVTLKKDNSIQNLLEMYDTQTIGLDGIIKILRGMVEKNGR